MNRDRLMWNLENWSDWHGVKKESLRAKTSSIYPSSGIRSTDDMGESVDEWAAKELETIINDIGERHKPRRDAIHVEWLNAKGLRNPTHEYDLEMAYESIMVISEKRGVV